MTASSSSPVTVWVGRLVLGNCAAWVVLRTLVTAPAVAEALRFDPAAPSERLWAFFTYPWVHESLLHLVLTSVLLLVVGPRVERELGPRAFVLFYFYGAVASAMTGVVLALLVSLPPMAGALGPALALLFALGWYTESEDVSLAPLPITVPGRVAVTAVALVLVVAGLLAREPGLSVAHAGGLLGGWLYFRLRTLGQAPPPPAPLPPQRPARTPIRLRAEAPAISGASGGRGPTSQEDPPAPPATAEDVNRVLDKISACGMESLTEEERRILTRYAEQQRDDR